MSNNSISNSNERFTVVFTDNDWELFRFLSNHIYAYHIGCGIEKDFPFRKDNGICICEIPEGIQALIILNNNKYTCEVEETWDGWYAFNGICCYDYHNDYYDDNLTGGRWLNYYED